MAKLSQDQKLNIDFDCPDKLEIVSDLLRSTEQAKEASDKNAWRFKRISGETVIVRDVLGKVAKWISHFKEIGDVVVQYDPGHAALPWAGVRLLLMVSCSTKAYPLRIVNRWQMAVKNFDDLKFLVEKLACVAELMARGALVEGLRLRLLGSGPRPSTAANSELKRALIQLYAQILGFLASARDYFRQPTASELIPIGGARHHPLTSS